MTDADGKLVASTANNWRFSPDSPNTATYKDPDDAYTYFGWWLNKPDDEDEAHTVNVFAGGRAVDANGDDAADMVVDVETGIVGTARYAGPAVGKYVTKTFSAGPQTDAGVGHFNARASLTAKFGEETGPLGTISGSIEDFVLDDTTATSWEVTLETTDLTTGVFGGATNVDFGGGAVDSGTANTVGNWDAGFYGGDGSEAPDTVVGTFDALTPNAAVIGAFGAKK